MPLSRLGSACPGSRQAARSTYLLVGFSTRVQSVQVGTCQESQENLLCCSLAHGLGWQSCEICCQAFRCILIITDYCSMRRVEIVIQRSVASPVRRIPATATPSFSMSVVMK